MPTPLMDMMEMVKKIMMFLILRYNQPLGDKPIPIHMIICFPLIIPPLPLML